jgi:2-haloacid dehalogenase
MDIQAVAFDTGGTVLDWHGGLVSALAAAGRRRDLHADWHAVANDWRRRSRKGIVGRVKPDFHLLGAIDFAIAKDYPARGEYAGPV